jgi:hypothetical protein
MKQRPERAMALILVVLAGAACGTATPSAALSLPPSPGAALLSSPTPTITPAPTPADAWQPVPDQSSVQAVQFQHVIWTGTRFVATGQALGAGGTFLDSSDGLTWHRQPTSSPGALPASLAAGPGGVVAVGTTDGIPASWFSRDGLTWSARADAFPVPSAGPATFAVTAAVATGAGWLAVGREDPYCNMNCGLTPVRAIPWTSSDGLHWTRVPDQTSLGNAAMTGVARLDSGFVAVGLAANRAVVWTSTDGSTWTRVPDAPLFHPRPGMDPSFWAQMTGVAVGHGVVVAVGMDGAPGGGGGSVLAWWSADGRTWTQATGDRFLSGQVFGLTATPEGFLATGPSGDPSCLGGIWASSDGRAWQCVASAPAFAGFGPYAAAASTSVEVAVGLQALSDPPPAGLPGAVWRRTLP